MTHLSPLTEREPDKVKPMPKMKTNKAIAKRIRVTAGGKLRRRKSGAGHLKSRKSPSQIRRFRKERGLARGFAKAARRKLGL